MAVVVVVVEMVVEVEVVVVVREVDVVVVMVVVDEHLEHVVLQCGNRGFLSSYALHVLITRHEELHERRF